MKRALQSFTAHVMIVLGIGTIMNVQPIPAGSTVHFLGRLL